jgi:GH15 family glucan-1,4-alpha-glucosidase
MVSLNDFFFFAFFFTQVFMLGGSELEEIELDHLDGHKGSRPVRIGNGAATHIQLVRMSA